MRWQKKSSQKRRDALARFIRFHRKEQKGHPKLMYSAGRKLNSIENHKNIVDLLKKTQENLGRPLKLLDSGAGLVGVSADIKRELGDKIEVTALTLSHPNISMKTERKSIEHAKKNPRAYFPVNVNIKEFGEEMSERQRELVKRARKDSKVVDHIKIGLIERMKTKKKFDVILDYLGPIQYSNYLEKVNLQYANSLHKGGLLLISKNNAESVEMKKFELVSTWKKGTVVFKRK